MTRTFIATLAGATLLGFSAHAMTLATDMGGAIDPTIKESVLEHLYEYNIPDENVGKITVIRKFDQNGEVDHYNAWIDMAHQDKTLVLNMDTAGNVLRTYTRHGGAGTS